MPSIPAETLKRLRKLHKLAKGLPKERFGAAVTRLTVLKKMCEELLANTLVEDFSVELLEDGST